MAGSATGTGNIFEFNGHYYEFIDSSTLWHDARDYAASQTYNGITGSLIRIDSAAENAFILEYSKNHITNDQWIYLGATDEVTEGEWVWEQGSEHFWTGDYAGSATNNQYTNFQPNHFTNDNHPDVHHYLTMWVDGDRPNDPYPIYDGDWTHSRNTGDGDGFAYVIEYAPPSLPATHVSPVYEFDGHYYQVVRTQTEWVKNSLTAGTQQEALDAAASMTYNGIQGHLVTITSEEENAFLQSILTTVDGYVNSDGFQVVHPDATLTMTVSGFYDGGDSAYYTAGSERESEGTFKWLAGPEEGRHLLI